MGNTEQPIKETPEETYNKCINAIVDKYRDDWRNLSQDLFWIKHNLESYELYRIERNKQVAPTDKDISLQFPFDVFTEIKNIRIDATKWMRKQFTE